MYEQMDMASQIATVQSTVSLAWQAAKSEERETDVTVAVASYCPTSRRHDIATSVNPKIDITLDIRYRYRLLAM